MILPARTLGADATIYKCKQRRAHFTEFVILITTAQANSLLPYSIEVKGIPKKNMDGGE